MSTQHDRIGGPLHIMAAMQDRGRWVRVAASMDDDPDTRENAIWSKKPAFVDAVTIVGGDTCSDRAARLLAQRPWTVPILGTTKLRRLEKKLGVGRRRTDKQRSPRHRGRALQHHSASRPLSAAPAGEG